MNLELEIYVQPGAKKTAISGKHDGRLKVCLKASPVDGKANQELITFLADFLKLRKQDIQIVRGEKSRFKRLSILAGADLVNRLKALGVESVAK